MGQKIPVKEDALSLAIRHHRAGRLSEAERLYTRILERQPNNPVALHLLGVIAQQKGKLEAAIDLIRKAIEVKPDYAGAYHDLGRAFHEQGRLEEALAAFRKALELKPDFAATYNSLGVALKGQGKLKEAAVAFRKALELKPDNANAHHNLGKILLSQGKLAEAVSSFRTALKLTPRLAAAHNNLGIALKALGRPEEALAAFRKALELRPDNAEAYNNLGSALTDQNKLAEAVDLYRKALKLKPDYAEAHNNLGQALKRQGKSDEAAEASRRAIELQPRNTRARYNYAMVHSFTADDPEIGSLRALLSADNLSKLDACRLLFSLGKAYEDIECFDDAFSCFVRANRLRLEEITYDPRQNESLVDEIIRIFGKPYIYPDEGGGDAELSPIFILGLSRSGKTLVDSMIAQHPSVFGADEARDWIEAVDMVRDKGGLRDPYPYCVSHLTRNQLAEIGQFYVNKARRYSPESKVMSNTHPANCFHVGLIMRTLPHAKLIHCVRDVFDNCLSIYFTRYRSGNEYSYDLRNVADYYLNYERLMTHWYRLFGDKILTVRYEDMVRCPSAVAQRIFAHCGLQFDAAAIELNFSDDGVGRWRHYEMHLGELREALRARG